MLWAGGLDLYGAAGAAYADDPMRPSTDHTGDRAAAPRRRFSVREAAGIEIRRRDHVIAGLVERGPLRVRSERLRDGGREGLLNASVS